MWRFFGTVLHFSGAERISMFASLKIAVLASDSRARRNMDARSGSEAVFRLSAPPVAAWLWHRGSAWSGAGGDPCLPVSLSLEQNETMPRQIEDLAGHRTLVRAPPKYGANRHCTEALTVLGY